MLSLGKALVCVTCGQNRVVFLESADLFAGRRRSWAINRINFLSLLRVVIL